MLEWDHLRIVLTIHRGGSMSSAAEALGVDRATILRRLDALESSLKTKLFERRPDGCFLTDSGRKIIGLVEDVEQAMTALTHRVEGDDRRTEGTVKLAAPEFFLSAIIAPALPALRTLYPGLMLEVRSDFDSVDLARGEADIALRFVRPQNEAIVARKVGTLAVALFATPHYLAERGTPKDGNFSGHDLLLLDSVLGQIPAMGWLLSQMQGSETLLRSNEVSVLMAAMQAGAGIACVPAIAAKSFDHVVPISPGVIGSCDIFLATHRDLRKRARVRSAYDFIVRQCAQHAHELSGTRIASQFLPHTAETPSESARPHLA